ncbi:ricin-type beta-trefoil lectin domain protein [Actinoplanes teichomyceticus]|nr:ricin-type beta-trefoil lectin domain protein [Actinoplanes teichomyceticus]
MTLLTSPVPAVAAPTPTAPSAISATASTDLFDDDGLPTDMAQKVEAAREIEIEPDGTWLALSDRNFVFKIWQNSANYPLVRNAAELALTADEEIIEAVCKAFIVVGIFDAKKADDAKKIADETAARQARDLRRAAYAAAGLTIDTDGRMLLLSERDAVYEIFTKAPGNRVKAAADAALRAGGGALHTFLASGVMTAADQDVQDAIKAAEDQGKEEQERIAREGAMQAAAAVLGVVADAGKLAMANDDFIRWIWETVDRMNRPEISAAAERALRSSDRTVWREFITTGIHTANKADLDRQLAEAEAADRRSIESIKSRAIADGADNLVTAATQALIGDRRVVSDFLLLGQHQVAPDEANRPSKGSWEWRNANSDQCLAIRGGSTGDGSPLQQSNCTHAGDQLWIGMRVYNTGGRYRLISAKDRTKCISVTNAAFVVRTCDGKADQYFSYKKVGGNYIWINEQVNRAITVQGASRDAGAPAITGEVTDSASQQWFATSTALTPGQRLEEARVLHSQAGHTANLQGDGNFVVYKGQRPGWATNTTTGVRLLNQMDGNLVLYRADNTPLWASNTAGNGPSTLLLQDDGNLVLYSNKDGKAVWYSNTLDLPVISYLNGKCADVPNSTFQPGTKLQMYTCNGSPAQKWMIINEALVSSNNQCAEVAGGAKTNGTAVQLGACDGGGAQRFWVDSSGRLVNPQSNKCVEIAGSATGDGAKLQISDCTTKNNQKWRRQ